MTGLPAQPGHATKLWKSLWSPVTSGLRSTPLLSPALPSGLRPNNGHLSDASGRSGHAWVRFYRRGLHVTDFLVIVMTVAASYWLNVAGVSLEVGSQPQEDYFHFASGIAVLWTASLVAYRTRESTILGVGSDEYRRVVSATLNVFGLAAIASVVTHSGAIGALLVVALPLGTLALTGSRWVWRRWINRQRVNGHYLSRVVVAGDSEDVRYVIRQLARKSGALFDVLGVLVTGGRSGMAWKVDERAVPVLGGLGDIVPAVKSAGATAVIVAGPLPGGNSGLRELGWMLEEHEAELVLASSLTNVAGPRMHLRPFEGLPLMHVDLPRYTGPKHKIKRGMDVVIAAGVLLALAPLFLVLALIIHSDSPGPVLFRQERVGKDGRRFHMIKFRSMVATAEDDLLALMSQNEGAGLLFKMQHDPRITRTGRWLRKYSLDELPQFWNVLRGDMSLVGPRPPLPREVELYERNINRRLLTKPGITGLWQISGRSDLPWEDAVRLDLYYVENWSMWGDLVILVRTLRVVIHPSGAY